MRVLVVDDDPAGLNLRRLVLERVGYEVIAAGSVDAARAALAALPDVVLMDLWLPDAQDGLKLLREAHDRAPDARVVVLSGYIGDLDGTAERAYASEVLSKPVPTEELLKAVAAKA